jgi:hypothetical protein
MFLLVFLVIDTNIQEARSSSAQRLVTHLRRSRRPLSRGARNQEGVMTQGTGTVSSWASARRVAWAEAAPTRKLIGWLFIGLAVGLFAGPMISNMNGWQVTAGAAQARADAAVVGSKSAICVAQARIANPAAAALDWSARRELAAQWAVMPGSTTADSEVTNTCTQGLAR